MREIGFGNALQHVFKFQQFHRKLLFQRLGQHESSLHVPIARLAEHALHAGVGILQIRRGVAFEREHVVPVEHIIAGAVFAQIGVFHRADAHSLADFGRFGFAQIGVFAAHQLRGAFHRFVQQINQFHRVAAARFEGLVVLAHHRAEADKFGGHVFRQPAGFAGGNEQFFEMQILPCVDHIQQSVCL